MLREEEAANLSGDAGSTLKSCPLLPKPLQVPRCGALNLRFLRTNGKLLGELSRYNVILSLSFFTASG
jgi:hypothetical protein